MSPFLSLIVRLMLAIVPFVIGTEWTVELSCLVEFDSVLFGKVVTGNA
jgi:hypothetical protein